MKDVRQCSISSIAFTLEVDAYDLLFDYIESIRARYVKNPDGEEILADIEARIAELILSANGGDRVVARPLIENIIGQLGSVDDICDEPDDTDDNAEAESSSQEPKAKIRKQLYRNVDNAPIGGVCSGIAAYIGCSEVVVRLVALLLLFFGGMSIWVYIILWIVMPAAVTARQKLEMRGEPITVSSINDYYNSTMGDPKHKSLLSSLLNAIGRIFMILFKFVLVVILFAFICAFLAILLALFTVVLSLGTLGGWLVASVAVMVLLSLGMLIALGVYAVMQMINSRQINGGAILIMLLIWLALTLITATIAAVNINDLREAVEDIQDGFIYNHHIHISEAASQSFKLGDADFSHESLATLAIIEQNHDGVA